MRFEPWKDFAHLKLPVIQVDGPPCKTCMNWDPKPQFTDRGEFSGVRLCWADDQNFDFSCYVEPIPF